MKNLQTEKQNKIARKRARIRAKISGTRERPRFVVARSTKHVSVQLVDDESRRTFFGISDSVLGVKKVGKRKREVVAVPKGGDTDRKGKIAIAYEVGKLAAEKAKGLGIISVVFDRAGRAYHGRIKAVAEGARDGGLKF